MQNDLEKVRDIASRILYAASTTGAVVATSSVHHLPISLAITLSMVDVTADSPAKFGFNVDFSAGRIFIQPIYCDSELVEYRVLFRLSPLRRNYSVELISDAIVAGRISEDLLTSSEGNVSVLLSVLNELFAKDYLMRLRNVSLLARIVLGDAHLPDEAPYSLTTILPSYVPLLRVSIASILVNKSFYNHTEDEWNDLKALAKRLEIVAPSDGVAMVKLNQLSVEELLSILRKEENS